jgi:hypothetical protein
MLVMFFQVLLTLLGSLSFWNSLLSLQRICQKTLYPSLEVMGHAHFKRLGAELIGIRSSDSVKEQNSRCHCGKLE